MENQSQITQLQDRLQAEKREQACGLESKAVKEAEALLNRSATSLSDNFVCSRDNCGTCSLRLYWKVCLSTACHVLHNQ